jgi:hypothetical protein
VARIRSLKPEAFESETLAKVSVDAERTLFGLTTIVDDRGRIADKPAQINGNLWSMRGGHTSADLDGELEQLVKADALLCRYTGCDGKRYMHLVSWDRHQKIDHPSRTRIPRCPHHLVSATGRAEECGLHEGNCPPRDTLARTREVSSGTQAPSPPLASPPGEPNGDSQASGNTTAPPPSSDQPKHESSRETHESSRGLAPDLGPRTVDLGPRTVPPTAGDASAPPTAQTILASFIDWDRANGGQLTKRVTGQLAKTIADLLDQKIDDRHIRKGLADWRGSGQNPSTFDSFVNAAMKGASANGRAGGVSAADQRRADVARLRELDRQQREGDPRNVIQGSVDHDQ